MPPGERREKMRNNYFIPPHKKVVKKHPSFLKRHKNKLKITRRKRAFNRALKDAFMRC